MEKFKIDNSFLKELDVCGKSLNPNFLVFTDELNTNSIGYSIKLNKEVEFSKYSRGNAIIRTLGEFETREQLLSMFNLNIKEDIKKWNCLN